MLTDTYSPWPSFSEEEIDKSSEILRSNKVNYWTGSEGRNFEKEFSQWVGTKHAIVVANGTVALDLAWIALGIMPGDEVIVSPRTFLASASSIVLAGGTPVFADVDPDSQNITPETVEPLITGKTRAILCVHLAGWPCEMDRFQALASTYNLNLVEDCAQAHGARYRGNSVGGLSDIGAWSFCQDKIMTTAGEGGMVTTSDPALWETMWSYKDHGKSWFSMYEKEHTPGFQWHHKSFGTNWRLSEIQSGIGRIQLHKMSEWHTKRTKNALAILDVAASLPGLRAPMPPAHVDHAYYRCYLFLEQEKLKKNWSRERIVTEIVNRGVPCSSGSCSEVYLEKAFRKHKNRLARRLPVARQLGETSLAFLVHPTLQDDEITAVIDALSAVLKAACR